MRTAIAIITIAGAVLFPLRVGASPTVTSAACSTETAYTCINGITNLNVMGSTYNLDVVVGAFSSLFANPANQLFSWGNPIFAEAANVAIAGAINQSMSATDQNAKFFDSGAQARYEGILHLPTEYTPYNGSSTGAFNSRCPVIVSFGVAPGGCGTWLTDSMLAFGVLRPALGIAAFSSYRRNQLPGVGGGYEASFDGNAFLIKVNVNLIGDPLAADVERAWEQGIEGFWGNQITLSDGAGIYPLLVDVNFATGNTNADFTLRVRNEYCRSFVDAISEWCTQPDVGTGQPRIDMIDEVAIHEFGHMLGLYDEYVGGGVDPTSNPTDLCRQTTIFGVPVPGLRTGAYCNSMMADFGPMQDRYFDDIVSYFEGVSGRSLTPGHSPVFGSYSLTDPGPLFTGIVEPSAIPEPPLPYLVLLALLCLATSLRYSKQLEGASIVSSLVTHPRAAA